MISHICYKDYSLEDGVEIPCGIQGRNSMWELVQLVTVPLALQLPGEVPEKAADGGCNIWTHVSVWERQLDF